MRRLVVAALAVLMAGGAFWLREQSSRSSFAAYTGAQLDTLEAGYRAAIATPPATAPSSVAARRDATLVAELSLEWLQTERHRRLALRGLAMVALLAVVGALLPGRRRARGDRGEEARLRKTMGDPAMLLEGERHKAARLLGVTPEAPPAVVDAALAAQLAAHDLGRLDGIAPEVRRMLLGQRQALQRARDLLVRGGPEGSSGAASQQ
jgi:hypothetical protein